MGRFLVIGGTTVLIDLLCYSIFLFVGLQTHLSKGMSFSSGTVFAYFANRKITFRSDRSGTGRFILFALLYLSTLGVNVFTNERVLDWFERVEFAYAVAFLLATGISATLNFIGMKFVVFTPKEEVVQ